MKHKHKLREMFSREETEERKTFKPFLYSMGLHRETYDCVSSFTKIRRDLQAHNFGRDKNKIKA